MSLFDQVTKSLGHNVVPDFQKRDLENPQAVMMQRRCINCGATYAALITGMDGTLTWGEMLTHPCNGPLLFSAADYLYQTRPDAAIKSRLLRRNNVETRLVQLSPDLYGLQKFNTYALRIYRDGAYVLSCPMPPRPAFLEFFDEWSPVSILRVGKRWLTSRGDEFIGLLAVDYAGERLSREDLKSTVQEQAV